MYCIRCDGTGFWADFDNERVIRCQCNPPNLEWGFTFVAEPDLNEDENRSELYSLMAHSLCDIVSMLNLQELNSK